MKAWKLALASLLGVALFVLVALSGIMAGGVEGEDRTPDVRARLGTPALEEDVFVPPADAVPAARTSMHVLLCRVVDADDMAPIWDADCIFHFLGEDLTLVTDEKGEASTSYQYGTFGSLEAAMPGYESQVEQILVDQDRAVEFRLKAVEVEEERGPDTEQGPQDPSPPQEQPASGEGVPGPSPPPPKEKPDPAVCKDTPLDPCPTYGPTTMQDRYYPDMSWAMLKAGNRFAVAWSSEEEEMGELEYSIDGGAVQTVSEGFSRDVHLIVTDFANPGARLEFRVKSGSTYGDYHAVHMGNAMTAWDEEAQQYTVNLLVLANEKPHRLNLQEGFREFGELLMDGTDGWVTVGQVIVVYDNSKQQDGGRVKGCQPPGCVNYYDIVFTTDEIPGAAGSAQLDGIQDLNAKITMQQNSEAPGPDTPTTNPGAINEVKSVLTHEFGHYAFGAMDFYCGGAIPAVGVLAQPGCAAVVPDCWVPATEVSIMAASRLPTEFDDEFNRCPQANEDWHVQSGHGYYPTWTQMRQLFRFKEIPDRQAVPNPGPLDDKGSFQLSAYDFKDPMPAPPV